ncbi:MAG: hypothetical protein GX025_05680 [Clostridiales bacterium]|nr:hypothetical protein [Clostridiales bacterium]
MGIYLRRTIKGRGKMKLRFIQSSVKEAIDNLPSGLCFFDSNGMLVLCNKVMHRLSFALTGRDLQTMSDLNSALNMPQEEGFALRDGEVFLFKDGTAWQFRSSVVHDFLGNTYIEYVAANVTKLYEKQKSLTYSRIEQEKLASHMRQIVDNITAITREEEILTMKMQIHNEVGWCLQSLRQFHAEGCPLEEKPAIAAGLNKIAGILQGEIGHDDEADALSELCRSAASLGVDIAIEGDFPEDEVLEILLVAAIRECVTNTLRHAVGDRVLAVITDGENFIHARISNNGKQPEKTIVEGGGFASLRRRIEKAGGKMEVQSLPNFALNISLPREEGSLNL